MTHTTTPGVESCSSTSSERIPSSAPGVLRTRDERAADLAYARCVERDLARRDCHAYRQMALIVVIAALLGALTVTVLDRLNHKKGAGRTPASKTTDATENEHGTR